MKCVICKHGNTEHGTTTVIFERNNSAIIIQNVPAKVCDNCKEAYVDAHIAAKLSETAELALKAGAKVQVQEYKAA